MMTCDMMTTYFGLNYVKGFLWPVVVRQSEARIFYRTPGVKYPLSVTYVCAIRTHSPYDGDDNNYYAQRSDPRAPRDPQTSVRGHAHPDARHHLRDGLGCRSNYAGEYVNRILLTTSPTTNTHALYVVLHETLPTH